MPGSFAFFAVSDAGAIFVPVNPVLKPAQVAHILNDCAVTALITSGAQAAALSQILTDCPALKVLATIDDIDKAVSQPDGLQHVTWSDLASMGDKGAPHARCIDNDVAAILYTSGSTGKPKGVVLSHRNLVMGAISVAGYLEHTADDVVLAALPFSFDAGFSQLTTAFQAGASVALLDYLLPQDVPRAAAKYGVTTLTGVPPLWNQVASLQWPEDAVRSMRCIANTGGAMPTSTLDKLRQVFPDTRVFLMYGLTESFRSTYLPPDQLDKRPTSIGKAIPNAEIHVVREDGTPCAPGEPGELLHRGALVSLGYWNDPERTAARFKPVPNLMSELPFDEICVWSGDTVVTDEEGFIYFVGRKDDMIKSSGYRISPVEIEEVVYGTGLVRECAALGIPHPMLGQAVVVAVTAQEGEAADSASIINSCKKALPNFMVPSEIIVRDTLPKNPNGKIDRKQLSCEYESLFEETS